MHDPRVGRFFAVDPLSSSYPHNSPYAFSENSTIAFVELEGLERYYAADGRLLGTLNNSSEIRMISMDDVDKAQSYINRNAGLKEIGDIGADYDESELLQLSFGFSGFERLGQKQIEAYGNVLDEIFNDVADLDDLSNGEIGLVDRTQSIVRGVSDMETRVQASFTKGKAFTVVEKKLVYAVQSSLQSNYFEQALTFYHESRHLTGLRKYDGTSFGEFNSHYATTQHDYYSEVSDSWKKSNLSNMSGYLDKQDTWLNTNSNKTRSDYKNKQNEYSKNKKLYEKEYQEVYNEE